MRKFVVITVGCALVGAGAAQAAQRGKAEAPAQVQRLMACRGIAAADQRLACFDRETASMNQAIAAKDLVLMDRQKAREASRSLFGFSIPNFGGLFGGSENEVKQIESKVTRSGRNADGGWLFYLADGSAWSQTDDWTLGLPPRSGDTVVVSRGLLGSFRLRLNKQPEIKVKRVG
ncbi:MAG: hypothetical protein M3448_08185 [Pseudomonadota bacterium]|jgi:hypothetical protein|nr:hypothetical protein [Pseudomonadota bacterium]